MNRQTVAGVMAELRTERAACSARLDALDLAIENLQRVFALDEPEPLALVRSKKTPGHRKAVQGDTEAAGRRAELLRVIAASPVGVTIGELRKKTPKMDGADRSNALTKLKLRGEIKRQGNAWVKAA
jgi:hypothetical protein